MAILGFELEEILRYIALVESNGLDEIIIEDGDRYLRLRGPRPAKSTAVAVSAAPAIETAPEPPAKQLTAAKRRPSAAKALPDNQVVLTSPMVGTFYRAEKPGAPPLVIVGQSLAVGDTIGIIEAMKIFSEVPAEYGGLVVGIPAPDGQLVQAGTPLVILARE